MSLAAAALSLLRPAVLINLDNLFFDTVARRDQVSSRCQLPVVVGLDDEALARFGHWPWPRALFARLLDRLAALGPSSVGIDVLFPEPDHLSGTYPAFQQRASLGGCAACRAWLSA
jgi:adenylate cyclase